MNEEKYSRITKQALETKPLWTRIHGLLRNCSNSNNNNI